MTRRRAASEPVQVDISELHEDGYGLTEDGRVGVFGTLPGESVTARPFTRKRKRLFARPVSFESTSPLRVEAPCSGALVCGGCSLQHMGPEHQIAYKQARLLAAFGDCQPEALLPPLTGAVSGYRSKARLGVRLVRNKGRVLVGFREKLSPYVADVPDCMVLAPPVGGMLRALAVLIESLSAAEAVPQIEVAVAEPAPALVFRHLEALSDDDEKRLAAFADQHAVSVWLQPGGVDSVRKLFPADGSERLSYRVPAHSLEMRFHPMDFTQVNQDINLKLIDQALALLELSPGDEVIDLFCGIGNFTLPIARRAAAVAGVELSAESIERAKENARHNGITNAEFHVMDLYDPDARLPVALSGKVLLDPPRSGALLACEKLATHKVKKVVYVSCNPGTLARDARVLVGSGYRMERAGVIDMFPHTTHMESIACFSS